MLPAAHGALYRASTVPTPIVAFAKDWHEDPTSNHHVLRELAQTRRVLWLNSLATRTPKLSSSRDLGKIRRKLVEFTRGPVNVENDLWVMSPLVLPLPHLPAARTINRQLLRATIRALRLRLGIRDFHLWTFLPNTGDYVGTLGEQLAGLLLRRRVVDVLLPRSRGDRRRGAPAPRAGRRDVRDQPRAGRRQARGMPGDVRRAARRDYAQFARALDDATTVPADLAALPHPRIGFFGTLQELGRLRADRARRARAAELVDRPVRAAAGRPLGDQGIPNVHLFGQRRHDELPAYCKGFDVGIIPYQDRRADDVREPAQDARVPLGGSAGGLDSQCRRSSVTRTFFEPAPRRRPSS